MQRALDDVTATDLADAVLALLDEGEDDVSAETIAARAGAGVAAFHHHFRDLDDVFELAIERRVAQIAGRIRPLPKAGSRRDRVDALVAQRTDVLEWLLPARAVTVRFERRLQRLEAVREQMYAVARMRLEEVFATELDRVEDRDRRTALIHALDGATSVGAWHHWRSGGLDVPAARRIMTIAVEAILDAAVDGP